jgi:hypothetical protein
MVEYYNLTKYNGMENLGEFMSVTSQLTNYMYGNFFLLSLFIVTIILYYRNNNDIVTSVHASSLISLLMSILFFVTNITRADIIIFLFAMVYLVTLFIKWVNRR